jgi:Fe-S-cluster containining protein
MSDENPCRECGGICCSFHDMSISWRSLPEDETFDEAKDDLDVSNLPFEDGEVPDMEWYVEDTPGGSIVFHCTHREDGLCTEYDRRPEMCRAFECAVLRGEQDLDEFKDQVQRPEDELKDAELRDITEEMKELIAEEAEGMEVSA